MSQRLQSNLQSGPFGAPQVRSNLSTDEKFTEKSHESIERLKKLDLATRNNNSLDLGGRKKKLEKRVQRESKKKKDKKWVEVKS